MSLALKLPVVHRRRLMDAADYLALILVASLPWSTSATAILLVIWLVVLVPTLEWDGIRLVIATPAGALPLLLVALAALGTLWADVAWSNRVEGLISFLRLAVIPLLFFQFRRSERGPMAIYVLLAACVFLLAASYAAASFPAALQPHNKNVGVVVKDYLSQSGFFTLAAFVLLDVTVTFWRDGRRRLAGGTALLAVLFIANIILVVTSRTTILVIPVLIVLFGYMRGGWKGVLVGCLAAGIFIGIAFSASSYLRERVESTLDRHVTGSGGVEPSSTALRLAFWKASFDISTQAPLFGHGTGTIRAMFQRYAAVHANSFVDEATNPHNQTFAVAIQLGLIGTLALYVMWLFHFLLFRQDGLIAWFGAAVVAQNFVGSLVNSHLFDFTQGWTYAVLVGIAGGVAMRKQSRATTT